MANPLQIAALVIPMLILLTSITIYYKSRKIKNLSYSILTDTEILPKDKELPRKIKIYYEEGPNKLVPIEDSRLLIIKISNDGNVPIRSSDFEEAISISFAPDVSILGQEIMDSPKALKKPGLTVSENRAILEPLSLNKNESIIMKLLIQGLKSKADIDICARIIGVRDIKKETDHRSLSILQKILLAEIAISIILASTLSVYMNPNMPNKDIVRGFLSLALFSYLFILSLFRDVPSRTFKKLCAFGIISALITGIIMYYSRSIIDSFTGFYIVYLFIGYYIIVKSNRFPRW